MIILTERELIEAFQCAFMEYHDLGPGDDEKQVEMNALQMQFILKVRDMCLKYPHTEITLNVERSSAPPF